MKKIMALTALTGLLVAGCSTSDDRGGSDLGPAANGTSTVGSGTWSSTHESQSLNEINKEQRATQPGTSNLNSDTNSSPNTSTNLNQGGDSSPGDRGSGADSSTGRNSNDSNTNNVDPNALDGAPRPQSP